MLTLRLLRRPLYTWTMRKVRGESRAYGENIHFPLSHNHKQNGWAENVENARVSRSDEESAGEMRETTSGEEPGVQDILKASRRSNSGDRRGKHRDTMREDLVSEGIINPAAEARPMSPTKPAFDQKRQSREVQKNSIGDQNAGGSSHRGRSHGSRSRERGGRTHSRDREVAIEEIR